MEKEVTTGELLEAIISGFSKVENRFNKIDDKFGKIENTMATKEDVAQVRTDLQSFKSETHERFDKLEEHLKENEASTDAIITDYHPHIIALEEKVFGHSTLADN